jgi:hypothetical protein
MSIYSQMRIKGQGDDIKTCQIIQKTNVTLDVKVPVTGNEKYIVPEAFVVISSPLLQV